MGPHYQYPHMGTRNNILPIKLKQKVSKIVKPGFSMGPCRGISAFVFKIGRDCPVRPFLQHNLHTTDILGRNGAKVRIYTLPLGILMALPNHQAVRRGHPCFQPPESMPVIGDHHPTYG